MRKSVEPKDPIEELLEQKASESLLIESFGIYKLKKSNLLKCLVFGILCAILSYAIGVSNDTINIFTSIVDTTLSIVLALLGIAFTGYTFFQALINGKLIELLISGRNQKINKNNFTEINESFVELMMLYISITIISFFLKIFCASVDGGLWLTKNLTINNMLAMLGSFVYLYISVMAIWHIKSFVYNIFQLFNMRAVREYLDLKKKENEKDVKEKT